MTVTIHKSVYVMFKNIAYKSNRVRGDLVIGIILICIAVIIFIAKILNCGMDIHKLMFLSIFMLLISIAIILFVINEDGNLGVSIRLISVMLIIYGIFTGIQVLRFKK